MKVGLLLAALVAVLAAFAGGMHYGANAKEIEWQAKTNKARADAEAAARKQETQWQEAMDETVKHYETRMAGVRRNLATALDGLRDRQERPANLPETARADCQDANGAELSGAHARFLARFAALAAGSDEGLGACYRAIDATHQGATP